MRAAMSSMSAGPRPRVVSAGVPRRMPEVYQAPFGSAGMALRLVTIPESTRALSACRPVSPYPEASIRTRWLSVPPVTSVALRRSSPSASAAAFATIARP
jgi:hypothetical protein